MNIFIKALLMGIIATFLMDALSIVFSKIGLMKQLIQPQVIGRWALNMLRGKFVHDDIHKSDVMSNEKLVALTTHYLIGIALAGCYLMLVAQLPSLSNNLWIPFLFGLSTSILPWFWLFPSIGLGFLASKTNQQGTYLRTSLISHINFGLGLTIWVWFRQF